MNEFTIHALIVSTYQNAKLTLLSTRRPARILNFPAADFTFTFTGHP